MVMSGNEALMLATGEAAAKAGDTSSALTRRNSSLLLPANIGPKITSIRPLGYFPVFFWAASPVFGCWEAALKHLVKRPPLGLVRQHVSRRPHQCQTDIWSNIEKPSCAAAALRMPCVVRHGAIAAVAGR